MSLVKNNKREDISIKFAILHSWKEREMIGMQLYRISCLLWPIGAENNQIVSKQQNWDQLFSSKRG